MRAFDYRGCCLIGKHKGVRASALPPGWKQWALENIKGFAKELETALARELEVEPATKPTPTGRKYTLIPFREK